MSNSADPALPLPDRTQAAFDRALAARGPLVVPTVSGVPHPIVTRWLYRRWLATQPAWVPLVLADTFTDADLPDLVALASGGWLALPRTAAVDRARLVLPGGPEVQVPSPRRMIELDLLFDVATDPSLVAVRRAVQLQARDGGSMALVGPEGSGRRALIRLAWAERAEGAALDEGAQASPESWAILDAELDHDAAARRLRPAAAPLPPSVAPVVRPSDPAFAGVVGESAALAASLRDAARMARTAAPILLLGEPGVGKELMARAIHVASGRSGPFEALDLSAVPRELVESELFGHVRGAFTGASADRAGAFRRAERGTLLLDELGNLEPAVQAKLLRVLQERVVRPVGGERTLPVDVRVIAATNADLDAQVARGAFRLDLLHRLNALSLRIPPLRERGEDVLLLARAFASEARGRPTQLTPAAEALLLAWPWPGNVRELWGAMQRAVAFSEPDEPIDARHLERLRVRRGATILFGTTTLPVAARIEVPALADRGEATLRHLVLSNARGRVVRAEAVDILGRVAWPNAEALRAAMDALLDEVAGPIDAAAVRSVLPHLIGGGGRELVVRTADGELRTIGSGVALIGRARGWDDIGGGPRAAALRALMGNDEPEFVAVSGEAGLSRVQVLVRRRGDVLEARRAPDAAATMWVGGVGGERRLEGQQSTAEVMHLGFDVGRRLGITFYAGSEAARRHAPVDDGARSADTVRQEEEPERVWELDATEREVLNSALLRYPGGDMSAHLRSALASSPRLAAYVLRVRPTQYAARLYEYAGNAALTAELRERLEGDVEAWLSALPVQLARVLRPRLA